MIRVLLRQASGEEAHLVGDFPPDQIDGLESLLMATELFNGEDDPEKPTHVERQLIRVDPPQTPRWCLEFIWFGSSDV